jgi:O-antigen/teichoic acid export membrane protein
MIRTASTNIQHIIQILLGKADKGAIHSYLIRGSAGSLLLRIIGTGLVFINSLVLARLLGLTVFGVYTYVITWVSVLAIPAVFGLDKMLIRNLAVYEARSDWGLMHGQLRWSLRFSLVLGLVLALATGAIAWMLIPHSDTTLLAFWIGVILIPIMALTRVRQGALQGLRHVIQGQFPETIVRPVLVITFISSLALLGGIAPGATLAVGAYIAAATVALIVGGILLTRSIPRAVKAAPPEYRQREWIASALPFIAISGMNIISTRLSILLLGVLLTPEAVGIYAVANRITDLIAFVLTAANTALSPAFARLYAMQDMQQLQRIVTRSVRVVMLLTLPIVAIIIVLGPWLLLLFGDAFTRGYTVLLILCIGQIVNVMAGSVGFLLTMTNHANDAAVAVAISLLLSTCFSLLLIPQWGLEGAAIAATLSLIVWNGILVLRVYQRIGVHSTALGKIT